MKTAKQAISLNEQSRTQAEALADLLVTAEHSQQITGGPEIDVTDVIVSAGPGGCGHVKVFNGSTGVGVLLSSGGGNLNNHNETVAYDEADLDELGDLLLTDAQEADIKGGGTWPPPGGTFNHNETVAEDEAPTSEALTDLPLEDAAPIKGGPVVLENAQITSYQLGVLDNNHGTHVAGTFGAVGNNNHNETTTSDEDNETLADLPVDDAEQIKGGPGGWGCAACDYQNHNETLAEDEATGAEDFACADLELGADLSITDEQAHQVKGGTDQLSVNYAKIKFEYKPQSAS